MEENSYVEEKDLKRKDISLSLQLLLPTRTLNSSKKNTSVPYSLSLNFLAYKRLYKSTTMSAKVWVVVYSHKTLVMPINGSALLDQIAVSWMSTLVLQEPRLEEHSEVKSKLVEEDNQVLTHGSNTWEELLAQ